MGYIFILGRNVIGFAELLFFSLSVLGLRIVENKQTAPKKIYLSITTVLLCAAVECAILATLPADINSFAFMVISLIAYGYCFFTLFNFSAGNFLPVFLFSCVYSKAIHIPVKLFVESILLSYRTNSVSRGIVFLISFLITMGILTLMLLYRKKNKDMLKLYKAGNISFLVATLCGICAILERFAVKGFAADSKLEMVWKISGVAVSIFFLTLGFVILITNFKWHYYKKESFTKERNVRLLIRYFNQIQTNQDMAHKLKHDCINHLISVRTLAEQGNTGEAIKYINELVDDINNSFLPEYNIGNPLVSAVVANKAVEADKFGIKLKVESLSELKPELLKDYELCSILFNILDNAIKATCRCLSNNNMIKLAIRQEGRSIFIVSKNPCNDEDAERLKEKHRNQVTGHGYGMRIVNEIVQRYNGTIDTEHINREMIIRIYLQDC